LPDTEWPETGITAIEPVFGATFMPLNNEAAYRFPSQAHSPKRLIVYPPVFALDCG
jgi:hypothetical protein